MRTILGKIERDREIILNIAYPRKWHRPKQSIENG